jgi:hypothetical protein
MAERNLVRIRIDQITMDLESGRILGTKPAMDEEFEGTAMIIPVVVPEDGGTASPATGNLSESGGIDKPWATFIKSDKPILVALNGAATPVRASFVAVINLDTEADPPDNELDSADLLNDAAAADGDNDATVEIVVIGNHA